MEIQILGTGCPTCKELEDNTKKAIEELKIDAVIKKVTDMGEILEFGIFFVPGFVVNSKVITEGKHLSVEDIKNIINENKETGNES